MGRQLRIVRSRVENGMCILEAVIDDVATLESLRADSRSAGVVVRGPVRIFRRANQNGEQHRQDACSDPGRTGDDGSNGAGGHDEAVFSLRRKRQIEKPQ